MRFPFPARKATPMLGVFAVALLVLAGCGGGDSKEKADESGAGSESADAPTGKFGEGGGVQWFSGTFEEALARAKEDDKMLLVDVWSGTCAQCGVMDEEVWATPEGASLVADAIAVKIPSDDPESYAFRHQYPITGLPAVLLLDSSGAEVNRIVGYRNRDQFLTEAAALMSGVDPLPDLEKRVEAQPDDAVARLALLEHYLYRAREADARVQMERILELDPENQAGNADKAVRALAKYYAFFLMDAAGSADIWKTVPERFPNSSSLTAAFKATLDHAKSTGDVEGWKTWACGLASRYSGNGAFNSAVAMYAFRHGVRGECLAEAARRAESLGAAPAGIDSVARILAAGS